MKGDVNVGSSDLSRFDYRICQASDVFQGSSVGRQSGCLDLHRGAKLHQLSHVLRSAAQKLGQRRSYFDRGDVATRVPCGPRPDTRTPWVLSSCRASRMAGLPTPNCSARARSEGIRSPGLTVPVETISL